jgi:enoyl-CoA hydratase/carnithine racemase
MFETTERGLQGPTSTLRIDLDHERRIATIVIERPAVLNALDSATHRAMAEAVRLLDADPSIGAIVIAGEGRAFCSGSDLREIGQLAGEAEREYVDLDFSTKNRVATCRKPVVAAVQGHCVGGGVELAIACDFRIAADDAQFAMPEVTLGALPGSGGLQRLAPLVGLGIAKEWIMTGRRVDASEAHQRGLVNRVVSADSVRAEAQAFAADLATRSALALELAKVALTPEPLHDRGLVAAFQKLAGDASHSQPRYAQATARFAGPS